MKAIVLKRYGEPEDLAHEDVPAPEPGPSEVLVRVHAAAINDWDWSLCRGTPFLIRALCGVTRPKVRIPGADVAGIVESVGSEVDRWRPGDRVFGDLSESGFGSFAELVAAPADALREAPPSLTMVEAAAFPHAAALALQGLRDLGRLRPNDRVLVNGAGGGVGTLAVQIARHLGVTDITGVDHGDKHRALLTAGFSRMIDYRNTDFTREGERYDLILDVRTDRSLLAYPRALRPEGRYVTVGGHTDKLMQIGLLGRMYRSAGRRLSLLALKPNRGLDEIRELCESNHVRPVVDRVFPLGEAPNAIRRFGDGLHTGKVVLSMEDSERAPA